MKIKIFFMSLFISASVLSFSAADDNEKVTGIWEGKLSIQGMQLRIVFNINYQEGKLTGTLDSPDQGAKGIPVGEIILMNDSISISVPSITGKYNGKVDFEQNKMSGTWSQSGMSLPLDMMKVEKVEEVKRPQTPAEPFPYNIEEVSFKNNSEEITLSGTLTMPKEKGFYPVVILVSGSGPQDRDETILNHKPFWVIADNLSRHGIAVLRFDDRGIGKSEGNFAKATTLDFVRDANAAVEYLRNRDEFRNSKIGIIGHSEGGLIAPLASVDNKEIDFIVMLAGPSLPGDEILRLQSRLIAKAEGAEDQTIERDLKFSNSLYEVLKSDADSSAIAEEITSLFTEYYNKLTPDEKKKTGNQNDLLEQNLRMINNPWFRYFLSYDPAPVLAKVTVPTLALYGEKDLQVPSKENIKKLKSVLMQNSSNKIMELKGLNHLFQNAETGSPTEYSQIEETFSTEPLKIIVDWIHSIQE